MNYQGAGIVITGSGSAIPQAVVSNEALGQVVETSDEWIQSRTGIAERRIAGAEESLCAIASKAAQNAIAMAQLTPDQIDLIILATSTPDDLFGTAAQIQTEIGATQAVAFDLTAACSGFVFGMVTAAQYIRTGVYRNVVLIGADILSRWVDWSDRSTCVLFGDGAGAIVMQADPAQDNLLGFELCSDGTLNHCLNLAFQGESKPLVEDTQVNLGTYQPITMNGREVYRFAVAKVPEVISKALFRADLTVDEIDWLLLHQANQRIIKAVAQRLKIPPQKTISNLAKYGNTSAASIPIALDEAIRSGQIQPGDIMAMSGFGAGLTWGAAIARWGQI